MLFRGLAVTLALIAAATSYAQDYPIRPMRYIVGFTPGTATDIAGRSEPSGHALWLPRG